MADWVGGLVQVAQLGASLLAQKRQEEEQRKRLQGDFARGAGRSNEDTQLAISRAYEDLDARQPYDRKQAAADIGFQRAAALGAPGVNYRRQAAKLLSGQEFEREDLDRRSERAMFDASTKTSRGRADLNGQLARYEDDHASDYIDPLMKGIGIIGTMANSSPEPMVRSPSEGAFNLGSGVRDPGYSWTPEAASGGDPMNAQLATPQLLQDRERDPYLDYRKFRL